MRATSTDAAPFSEKKTRSSRPGASATSRAASSMAGGWVRPRNVEWASRPSCSTMAASMAACPWPWTLTHNDDTPSR